MCQTAVISRRIGRIGRHSFDRRMRLASPLFQEKEGDFVRILNEVDKLCERLHMDFPTITGEDYRLFGPELKIVIKTLNTRVDTARDLVLKLYHTTTEMVRTAELAERLIVYVNRYRENVEVNKALEEAEKSFYKGNYKESLDLSIKATSIINEEIYRKLMVVYEK